MKKQLIKDLLCMDATSDKNVIVNVGVHPMISGSQWINGIKDKYPTAKVLVDLKISGEDFLNAKTAFDEGADIVSVLGVASDEVIRNTLLIAEALGKEVLVDFIGVEDEVNRLVDMDIFGVHYVCLRDENLDRLTFEANDDVKLCYYDIRQYSYLLNQERVEVQI